jgi:hypothetical protein
MPCRHPVHGGDRERHLGKMVADIANLLNAKVNRS